MTRDDGVELRVKAEKIKAEQVLRALRQATDRALMRCGAAVEREAKMLMKVGGKQGGRKSRRKKMNEWVEYRSQWKARGGGSMAEYLAFVKKWEKRTKAQAAKEVPSDPGDPPNVQTGNLRASITHALTGENTVVCGPTRAALYGQVHEFGGRHHPKRPFMKPGLLKAMQAFPQFFKDLPVADTEAGRTLNAERGIKSW